MPSLRSSKSGLQKIKDARVAIGWPVLDSRWLDKIAEFLPPSRTQKNKPQQDSASFSTWKRFLYGGGPVGAEKYKAFCQALNLDWKEVVDPAFLPSSFKSEIPEAQSKQSNQNSQVRIRDWKEFSFSTSHTFRGRSIELSTLNKWIHEDQCRLVAVTGIGGVGKSSIAENFGSGGIGKSTVTFELAKQSEDSFEVLIWKSLNHAPSFISILDSLINTLSQGEIKPPENLNDKVDKILEYFYRYRCLIIFDNLESIFISQNSEDIKNQNSSQYIPGYEEFGQFLNRVGNHLHKSCLLITSRRKPVEVSRLEGDDSFIRTLELKGLDLESSKQCIKDVGNLTASDDELEKLIEYYKGHPLAIKVVAKHITEYFSGKVSSFFQADEYIFGDITDLLNWHFSYFSQEELEILYWLAINKESVSIGELKDKILDEVNKKRTLNTLLSLQRKFTIEKDESSCLTLQPFLMEYTTDHLIRSLTLEIREGSTFTISNRYSVLVAKSKDYIRKAQVNHIVSPLVRRLQLSRELLIKRLFHCLEIARSSTDFQRGYLGGNIINLLCYLDVSLVKQDFSKIAVWQAYLSRIFLRGANFSFSDFKDLVFTSPFGGVSVVVFSPRNDSIAIGHMGHESVIWNLRSQSKQYSFKGHKHWIQAVAYNKDGSLLVTAAADGTIRIWDLDNRGILLDIIKSDYSISDIHFHPIDSQIIGYASGDKITISDRATKSTISVLSLEESSITKFTFNCNGSRIFSCTTDGDVQIWDATTGQIINCFNAHSDIVSSLVISPDNKYLITGGYDKKVKIWNIEDLICEHELSEHLEAVLAVACSKQNYIASGSRDKNINIWSISEKRYIQRMTGHIGSVLSLSFNPDGQLLCSGAGDLSAKVWQVSTGACNQSLEGYGTGMWSMAYDNHSNRIYGGGDDGIVRIWEQDLAPVEPEIKAHNMVVWSLSFNSGRTQLLTASGDKLIRLWNISTGTCIREFSGHNSYVRIAIFSPDDRLIASGGDDHNVRLWSDDGTCIDILAGHDSLIYCLIFGNEPNTIISGSQDCTIRVWDITQSCEKNILEGHTGTVTRLLLHDDILISASEDSTIKCWNIKNGILIESLEKHTSGVTGIALNSTKDIFASCSSDKCVHIWSLKDFSLLFTLKNENFTPYSLEFANTGELIMSSVGGRIEIWDLNKKECLNWSVIPRMCEKMDITGTTGISQVQKDDLVKMGAIDRNCM